jgi:membrane-bound lytic murein transglycosylase MltF
MSILSSKSLKIALGLCLLLVAEMDNAVPAQDITPKLDLRVSEPWTGDLDGMMKRRVIRFLVPYSKTVYFLDKGEEFGTAVERGRAFEDQLNQGKLEADEQVVVVYVPLPRDQLIPALNQGLGDIVAASLTVTPERRKDVDFGVPLISNIKEVLVTGPAAPGLSRLEDLSGRDLYVRKTSSYYEHLAAVNDRLKAAKQAPIDLVPADETLEDEDLLEMVNAGLLPYAIVDDYRAEIWAKVFPDIKIRSDITVSAGGDIAWAIRKNSPLLKDAIDDFAWTHKLGTAFGNMLKSRYYTNDTMVRRALSPNALQDISELADTFQKYGEEFDFDSLLIMAQGYQESGLDQQRVSPSGAVGVMQLLPSTAASKDVDVPDIASSADRNIYAGAKYLRYLISTYISDPHMDDHNRALFAFAAYNAGPANLKKFRDQAQAMGLDPNRWFDHVEHAAAAIVGRQTVQYVSNIRKYYIGYTLSDKITLKRAVDLEQAEQQKH